jgi:hypothetical protein
MYDLGEAEDRKIPCKCVAALPTEEKIIIGGLMMDNDRPVPFPLQCPTS